MAAPAVYAKKERSKLIKVVSLLQPVNAKRLLKKEHAVVVKQAIVVIAGNMEDNLF